MERIELLSASVSILACSSAFLYSSRAVLRDSNDVFIFPPAVSLLVILVNISAREPRRPSIVGFIFSPIEIKRLLKEEDRRSAGVTVFSKASPTSPAVSPMEARISLYSSALSPASWSAALPASIEPNISTRERPFSSAYSLMRVRISDRFMPSAISSEKDVPVSPAD